jgi:hypothetical protein
MKLPVDTSAIAFLCAPEPQPVLAFETKQPRRMRTVSRCTWCS